ncbi:glycoside hydrolase [Virgisporangium aliadipatigenens]|uniref:Glycoside hydrolase n=1 Tax=Virgisporangium aliadipatigenens TaxID=741659 RepID=A0A8J4DMG2_9ACTN|nr:beta-galactosidase [Virgisporangium aliadipatigenens]GIJ43344.1 glycoside hydrolase [Virgisporangium aliadipatigenens]
MATVSLDGRRILIDGRPRLVLAGEVHYFRLAPDAWAHRLILLRDAGCDTVATYVPWLWHELPDGTVDLHGRTHPQRDLAGFLDLAHAHGLRALVRPGPFVMAELKNEGIPHRLYRDSPHLVPVTWDGAPVPSRTLDYLAPAFLDAAERWYAAVMPPIAARLATNGGPVVAVQLDNEIGMLSWITNSPDLTDEVCGDLRRWAVARYGPAEAAARVGAPVDDPRAWAAALRRPAEERSLAVHDDIGRYMRDRYRRYVAFLHASARRHGVVGVPFLVNVHGTSEGRGRTFPIGISQLFESYRGIAQLTSGSDLYLGDLTVTNAPDLYVANAFLAAAHDADQPLTSLEFEAGSGDYGEDLSTLHPPEAVELKTRLCVAQGTRLLNLYLFAGGHNPPLETPVGDGNDRIAFTGERHGFAAPVGPEGALNAGYGAVRRVFAAVRAAAAILADSDEENDGFALAFVPDHYLTEYRHPASAARAAQVADLERFRGTGPRDVLARALLLAGFSFPAVDVQSASELPPVLVLASAATLRRNVQERLAAYVRDGGRLLLHGLLPERDVDGTPCTVLADALGLRVTGRVDARSDYFPSVTAAGRPEVRVGHAQLLAGGTPVLRTVHTGEPCAVDVTAGVGRAMVIAADYPCDLGFWRDAMAALGVTPRLRHDADPGLLVTSTVDGAGQRLLHLLNVAPSASRCTLAYRDRPVLGGRRLHLPARAGLMLPYGIRIGPATLRETTCELLRLTDAEVVLRPTQEVGADVAVFDTPPTRITGGETEGDGTTVIPTGTGPLHVTFDRANRS